MIKPTTNMLIIELNEFCPKHLEEISEKLGLENIRKILNFNHSLTFSKDKKEFQGLDPWVQWVSIHKGVSLKKHGIKRLGINKDSRYPQIWNSLAKEKNLTWIVTGVMNAKKGNSKGCISFFPDPWSSNEKAFPKQLNLLLELPRYVSKNYLSLNYLSLFKKTLKALFFFSRRENLNILKKLLLKLLESIIKPGINIHTLTTLLDYILVLYFSRERLQRKPDLSIIFLNHIAHLQHHFWMKPPFIHPQMEHGIRICDEIIGILLDSVDYQKDKIIIMNAFKQKRSDHLGIQVYRQKNPKIVLNKLNINNVRIEQNMTNDGTLFFKNKKDKDNALKILKECRISSGEKLFFIEKISSRSLFIQLNLNHKIPKETMIISGKNSIPFYEVFENLSRTGSHIPNGDIFSKNMKIPDQIENHKIYDLINNSFN